jgi:hypothetical protein
MDVVFVGSPLAEEPVRGRLVGIDITAYREYTLDFPSPPVVSLFSGARRK